MFVSFTYRDDVEYEIALPLVDPVAGQLCAFCWGDSWCRVKVIKVLTSNVSNRR